jgi:periplasmic divalent cation tolerance protein
MTDSAEQAATIADTLVRERLAACAQVMGPMDSVYRWQGRMESTTEWQCVLKTRDDLYEKVEARIMALHSYEVPAIIAVPVVHGSRSYLEWMNSEVETS